MGYVTGIAFHGVWIAGVKATSSLATSDQGEAPGAVEPFVGEAAPNFVTVRRRMDIPLGTPPEFVIKVRREIAAADIGARECLEGGPAPVPRKPTPEPEFEGVEKHDKPIPPRVASGSKKIALPTFKEGRRYAGQRLTKSPLDDLTVRALYETYKSGLSMADCVGDKWEEWDYKSLHSCANALGLKFKKLGLPSRDRIAASIATRRARAKPKPERSEQYRSSYYRRKNGSPLAKQIESELLVHGDICVVISNPYEAGSIRQMMYNAGTRLGFVVRTHRTGLAVHGRVV